MNPDIITSVRQSRLLKPALLVVTGLLLAWIIYAALTTVATHPQRQLVDPHLEVSENFGYLSGTDLYAYNGMAFYKVDIANNSRLSVIHQGNKLPTPKNVWWAGSTGALMTFDESFSYTGVEETLRNSGRRLTSTTESWLWYFDFRSGSLTIVDEEPVLQGLASFSKEQNGFYYITDTSEVTSDILSEAAVPLKFFSLATKQSTVVADDLGVVDGSYLGPCRSASMRVCIVARDQTNIKSLGLYGITKDGDKKERLLKTSGRIVPTNSPELFIKTAITNGDSGDRYVDIPRESAILYNLETGTETNLGFKFSNESVAAYVSTPQKFYALANVDVTRGENSEETYFSGAPSLLGSLNLQSLPLRLAGKPYSGGVTSLVSYGDNEITLISSKVGNQLLFSPNGKIMDLPLKKSDEVQKIINTCLTSTGQDSQYFEDERLFKVFFSDDASLDKNIVDFSKCMSTTDIGSLVGYNYYFGVVNPVNGRISSD